MNNAAPVFFALVPTVLAALLATSQASSPCSSSNCAASLSRCVLFTAATNYVWLKSFQSCCDYHLLANSNASV